MQVIKGIPVSPGIAIGRAHVLETIVQRVPRRVVPAAEATNQVDRLKNAVERTIEELSHDRDRAEAELGPEPAKIFEFHIGLLRDKALIGPIEGMIERELVTAEFAVSEAFRSLASQFRAMGSEVFRHKANDVLDLDSRLLNVLIGLSHDQVTDLNEPVIIVAHEMTPGQTAALSRDKVLAIVTDAGGRTSHTSIVARTLGIPVVVGLKDITALLEEDDQVVVDGKAGVVVIRPDAETLQDYHRDIKSIETYQVELRNLATQDSVTLDGVPIKLMGNIEFPDEIRMVLANGGDGVGLYRTEFLYLTSDTEPTEDDQYESYRHALELLNGNPLTIRTLDLGADKYTQQRAEEPERNPFLGCRSIRYCLQNLPMFKCQLRAILRASVHGPLRVMFPLISTPMELRQTKMILEDVKEECIEAGIEFERDIPTGIMIEVPSAALMATTLAREVEFFSIGTNDLIQYTLAVDRGNERVANLYTGSSPAVLQLVKAVIRAGKRFNIETSICGEIAGEVTYTMLLIGLGLRTLSMVPSQIPHVKRIVRSVDIAQCERLARKVGSFDSERRVLNCLREETRKLYPETNGGWSAG